MKHLNTTKQNTIKPQQNHIKIRRTLRVSDRQHKPRQISNVPCSSRVFCCLVKKSLARWVLVFSLLSVLTRVILTQRANNKNHRGCPVKTNPTNHLKTPAKMPWTKTTARRNITPKQLSPQEIQKKTKTKKKSKQFSPTKKNNNSSDWEDPRPRQALGLLGVALL